MRRLPRPRPAATPLQKALGHFSEALREAQADPRTFAAFVAISIDRIAAEAAKLLEQERRP